MNKKQVTKNPLFNLFFQICLCILLVFAAVFIRDMKKNEAVPAGNFGDNHSVTSFTLSDLAADTESNLSGNEFWTAFFRIND